MGRWKSMAIWEKDTLSYNLWAEKYTKSTPIPVHTPASSPHSPPPFWAVYQYLVHILPAITDNCSSWISGRGRMAVEMFSWPSLHERMCLPSGHTSNWAAVPGQYRAEPIVRSILMTYSWYSHCAIQSYMWYHLWIRLTTLFQRTKNKNSPEF